jgi:hypothetical protein
VTGTWINVGTILIGGTLGLMLGARIPARARCTVVSALGLFTFALGVQMFLQTQNPLIVLGALLIGGLLGEWWGIEGGLQNLGRKLEARFMEARASQGNTFIKGFLTASLLFCVGPMTILGSIQDGLTGDYRLLTIKAVMDGFAAMALASTLGPGVLFSILVVLGYQGGISLAAGGIQAWLSDSMIQEMTASGGVLMLGLAVSSLLEIRAIRTGNLLPALAVAPLIAWLVERF